jgi:rifampicin phosphotransferase
LGGNTEGIIGWLADPVAAAPGFSGGKGANLAVLAQAGLPVPAGFVIGTGGYRRFVAEHSLNPLSARDPLIGRLTGHLSDAPAEVAEDVSQRLRRTFEEAATPEWLSDAVATAYHQLGDGPVAVRSSATAEDLPQASFAGQLDSVLDVTGVADVCRAVVRCWSSLWTTRALAYRAQHGIGDNHLAVAVVVQRMVASETAGVLFSADPVSGRRDHTVIEAAAGLGTAVVGGHVTPQRWLVDTVTGKILERPHDITQPVLADNHVEALTALGARAVTELGSPQDVEFAIEDGRCRLLQSRPITTLFPLPDPRPATGAETAAEAGLRVYVPIVLIGQGITEPLTPAGTAYFRALAAAWIPYWAGGHRRNRPVSPPWIPVLAGRIFWDLTPLLQRPRIAAWMLTSLTMKDPTASAVLRQWLGRNAHRLPPPRGPRMPGGLVRLAARQLPRLAATIAAPARTRRRMLARTEQDLAWLHRYAESLTTPWQRLDFVEHILPQRTVDLIQRQVPAVYGELLARALAQRIVERRLHSARPLEPVRRWLPHDPTVAMGVQLARLAQYFAATGTQAATSTQAATDPHIRAFLDRYGHRAPDREIDLGLPRFADEPAYLMELIRTTLRSDPDALLARAAAGSAQATRTATELVTAVRRTGHPFSAWLLRTLLDRRRHLGGLRERPKFDMVRAMALGRHVLGQVGTQLVADGLLDDADDVFYLDPESIHAQSRDLRELVRINRREYEHELRRQAVPLLLASDGETVYRSAEPTGKPGELTGTAVSPGVCEGVVRVLDSPVGAKLRSGEVLVAASTDPGWTPLFLSAGALVMQIGGVISHGAVVAREYGIPAVADIADATERLHTGQRVRVNGDNGTVTLLDAGYSA